VQWVARLSIVCPLPTLVSGILGVIIALTCVDMRRDTGPHAFRPIDGGPDSHITRVRH